MVGILSKFNRDDTSRAAKSAADTRNKPARKARLQAPLRRKQGGPTNPISTKGSYGGKKKVAKADWMQGLSPAQIQEILGGPTKDASGVTRHTKKKTKKKVVKAMGGGKVVKKSRGGKSMRGGLNLAEKILRNREDNIKRKKLTKPKILKEMDSYKKQETYGEYDAADPPPKKKRKSSGSYGKAALGGVTEKDLFYGLKETGSSNTKKQGSKNKPIRLKKPKEGKSDSSVTVDYTVIDKLKSGGKIKGYKKGGPITYRMTGGQVVDNSYD